MRACFLSLFVLVSFVPPAHAQERPMVAVLDFSVSGAELTSAEIGLLADVSRAEARRVLGDGFTIITQESIQDLLKSHGKTLEQCQGVCETETGKLLGAEYVVSGKILKAFGAYKVNLKVHRTSPPELLDAVVLTVQALAELEDAVREGTAKILAKIGAQRSTPAPAPPSAPAPAPRPRPPPGAAPAETITPSLPNDLRERTSWFGIGLVTGSVYASAVDEDEAANGFSLDVMKLRWPSGDENLTYFKLNFTNVVAENDGQTGVGTANVGYGWSNGPSRSSTFELGLGVGAAGYALGAECGQGIIYEDTQCINEGPELTLRVDVGYELRVAEAISLWAGAFTMVFAITEAGIYGAQVGMGF
jgi:hypothetical protein